MNIGSFGISGCEGERASEWGSIIFGGLVNESWKKFNGEGDRLGCPFYFQFLSFWSLVARENSPKIHTSISIHLIEFLIYCVVLPSRFSIPSVISWVETIPSEAKFVVVFFHLFICSTLQQFCNPVLGYLAWRFGHGSEHGPSTFFFFFSTGWVQSLGLGASMACCK